MKNGKAQETFYKDFQSQEIVSWGQEVWAVLPGLHMLNFSQVKLGIAFPPSLYFLN